MIVSNIERFEIPKGSIEVKRFYLPVEFEIKCPKCGTHLYDDFEQQYLSFPYINENEEGSVYCENCELHCTYPVKLQVTVEARLDEVKLEEW